MALITASGCLNSPGKKEFDGIQRIEAIDERLTMFSSFPIDKQIDIFLYAQRNGAGFRDTYFRFLANEGENKKLDIARRIDVSQSASHKADLLIVLDFIDTKCRCVNNDSEVMTLLEKNLRDSEKNDPPDVSMSKDFYRNCLQRIKVRGTS